MKIWPSGPKSFSKDSGEPLVVSDEDVVVTYTALGFAMAAAQGESRRLWDGTKVPWVEYQERVLSFSSSIARDIQFNIIRIIK